MVLDNTLVQTIKKRRIFLLVFWSIWLAKNGSFKYSSKENFLNILGPETNDFDIVLGTENNLYFYAKQNSKC